MVDATALNNVVVESFRVNALRSVLLVDERFPKLHQVGTEAFTSQDAEVCKLLYEKFNSLALLCDVENDVEKAKKNASELVRKSDLLILDLHLNKTDPGDTTDATQILQSLADSEQFNLVIVYTNEKEIGNVAVRLAGSLRGTEAAIKDIEARDAIELKLTEALETSDDIPYEDCMRYYLFPGTPPTNELGKFLGQIAKEVEKPHKEFVRRVVVSKLALKTLERDYQAVPQKDLAREIEAGKLTSENPWFVCGSVLVVIANKQSSPPGTLLDVLDRALTEWNPGVVRCLLSEVYNCIGKSGYSFRSALGKDVATQIGWLYHALHELKKNSESAQRVIDQLSAQVIGLLREKVAKENSLNTMALNCLNAVEFKDDPQERVAELKIANGIPEHTTVEFLHVLHALNEFLSSIPFGRRPYVTTGTVLKEESEGQEDQWWLCVEPQCDTVPEQAGDNKFIRLKMLKLHKKTNWDPLKIATRSRFVFVECNGVRICLDTRDGTTDTHEICEFYVNRTDQISWEQEVAVVQCWKPLGAEEVLTFAKGRLVAVSQLRAANASRFLNEAGHHQSRVGVDFLNCSEEDMKALNKQKGK